MSTQCVGIDVSKQRLDVHVHPAGERFHVARTEEGVRLLADRLRPLAIDVIAIEATGGYESLVVYGLREANLPSVIVDPAQVRHYAKALGKRAKTDAIDAQMIARFAQAMRPEVRDLPDAATRYLSDLLGRRRQIVEMIASDKQRGASHHGCSAEEEHHASTPGVGEGTRADRHGDRRPDRTLSDVAGARGPSDDGSRGWSGDGPHVAG